MGPASGTVALGVGAHHRPLARTRHPPKGVLDAVCTKRVHQTGPERCVDTSVYRRRSRLRCP